MSEAGRDRAYPPDCPRVDLTKPPRRNTRIILATFGSEIPSARESSGIVTLPPSPARPTRSRQRSPYSSCDDSFIGSLRSHHSELQLRGVGHHLQAPRRIEHDLDVGLAHVRHGHELRLDVFAEDVAHAAARRGEGELDVDLLATVRERRQGAAIDEAEVHDIDGDLGVVARAELVPDELLGGLARLRRDVRRDDRLADRVGVLAVDASEESDRRHDGVAAAERLGDDDRVSGAERDRRSARNLADGHVARDGGFFSHLHYWAPPVSAAGPSDSVETVSPSPERAALSVCHGSVAHLTRTGYSRTPEKTASLPSSGEAAAPPSDFPVIRSWKRSKRASASAFVFPLTLSVIIEADAVEIAQPAPWKLMSFSTSPSRSRNTVSRSPQRGL